MYSITLLSWALYRLLPHDIFMLDEWINHHSDWIANHTGYLSFLAEVCQDEDGRFMVLVCKRAGYTVLTFSYEKVMDCVTYDTFRHAMSMAHHQACQLAHLHYAWEIA
jgi:hypothetical protein